MAREAIRSARPAREAIRSAPLDGMRAAAVTAVIVFHGASNWAPGGYLGVDVFFVLSGYLITSLLLAERRRDGRIAVRAFWARRGRRLLPALFVMLAVVGAGAALFPAVLGSPDFSGDAVSTVGYVANWHFIAAHSDYFATTLNPSPLLHTWTLAIEEQFYVIWPILVIGLLGLGAWWWRRAEGRARDRRTAARAATSERVGLLAVTLLAGLGAIGSALLMASITPAGAPEVNRSYYGTDTRMQALLVGAALAGGCGLWGPVRTAAGRRVLGLGGLVGAAGVLSMWRMVPQTSALAFHGGIFLLSVATAAVIASVAQGGAGPLGKILSLRPLPFIGRISYGMYLWYWPALLVMSARRTHLHGTWLLVGRLSVITAIAAASYHFVEMPIRRGALARWRALVGAGAAGIGVCSLALLAPVASTSIGASAPVDSLRSEAAGALVTAAPPGLPGGFLAPPGLGGGVGVLGDVGGGGAQTMTYASAFPPEAVSASGAVQGFSVPLPAHQPVVRILLVGDSMAGSLGVGLAAVAPRYGAEVVNRGTPGCAVANGDQVKVLWFVDPPGPPCSNGANGVLDSYRALVARFDPDVVVYFARGDTLNTQIGGTWEHVGEPAFDRRATSRFEDAVSALSSGGAHVALMTSPLYDSGEQGDGQPWPENDPGRVAVDNRLLGEVARRDSATATLVGLGSVLSPAGRYAARVDGVTVRCTDGVHITVPGGAWLGERLLPRLVALGRTHAVSPSSTTRAVLAPQPDAPWWYPKLPCAG